MLNAQLFLATLVVGYAVEGLKSTDQGLAEALGVGALIRLCRLGTVEGLAPGAMGGLNVPDTKAFAISANMSFYDDKQALAAQAAVRLNTTFQLTGGIGVVGGELAGAA